MTDLPLGCATVLLDWPGQPRCGHPAYRRVITGCVHEHLEDEEMCLRHLQATLDGNEEMCCVACKQADDGHHCPIQVIAEVDDHGNRRTVPGVAL